MNKKPQTSTLLSIVSLVLTVAVIIFALYSSRINTTLETLHATDVEVKVQLQKDKQVADSYRDDMSEKVQDIYLMLIQLGATPPKRNQRRIFDK